MIRAKYLKNSLKVSKDIFQKAYVEFMSVFNQKINETKRPSSKAKKQGQEKQEEKNVSTETPRPDSPNLELEKEEKDENLKQAFRKIALEVHPDKLEGLPEFEKEYKKSLFNKARMALQENDYYAIVEVSEELGIEPPEPTKNQIEAMKKTNSALEKEIKKIEESVIWAWYHSDDDKRKITMDNYIAYLEKQHLGS